MEVVYNPSLVFLSIMVAILASYVALNLAYSVTQAKGRAQAVWLACGSLAMGVGIWSMHFVGMLAFEMPGMEMAYDVPLMSLSVVVAILGSALALFVVSRPQVQTGSLISSGIAMAAAISGMHYIGMYSMRMEARIQWNVYLVIASILIALAASFAALTIAIRLRNKPDRLFLLMLASILMGAAISGMHYTGMFAATFIHDSSVQIEEANILVTSGLVVATLSTTLLILGIALYSSIGMRIMSMREERSLVIQERESQLRTITNAIPTLVAQVDRNERILFANDAFCDWFNRTHKEVSKLRFEDVLGEDRYPANKVYIDQALDGKTVSYERLSFSGSRKAILNITFVPEYDNDKRVKGFIIVAADVSKYKEIEAELKKAKEQAEVANETKSAFLANMSHEIRTPLGAVIGFSELMIDPDMSPSEKLNSIEIIRRNGKLLSTIINDILDLSKVEAGKLEIEKTDVDLFELLSETAALLNLDAAAKGVRLTVAFEGVVPNIIKTDSTRLRQILFNIVGNAIKFTEKGVVSLTVKLSADNSKLNFVVQDTGTGITPEQAQRLFSPFTQADATTTRRFGGTGLGLSLSKKLAIALGGNVVLEDSTIGKGSTFVISLDHGQSKEIIFESTEHTIQEAAAKVLNFASHEGTTQLSNLNILVVDDSLDNLALIKRLLTLSGAQVATANSGQEGVEKALKENFSLVLMDLQMPDMDGYEATKELRGRGFDKPIIALTAHAMKEERKRCLENGFNNHLTKPIDRNALIHILSEYPA